MNHYKDLILPTSCSASVEHLNDSIFSRLYPAAKKVVFSLNTPSLTELASTTLGFSRLNPQDIPQVEIFIPAAEFIEESGIPPNLSKRLGWIRWLVEDNRCAIYSQPHSKLFENLRNHKFESESTISVVYGENDYVAFRKQTLQNNEHHVELYWPYGDPDQIAKNLKSEFTEWTSASSKQEIDGTPLDDFPAEAPPFDESEPVSEDSELPKLFEHQSRAVEAWFDNDCRGIFDMCTGAGKTITSLACIKRLMEGSSGTDVYLVTVPTRVLADQWGNVLGKIGFPAPLKVYNSFSNYAADLSNGLEFCDSSDPLFLVSTYKSFGDDRIQNEFRRACQSYGKTCCWIADEAHNLAPTSMLRILREQSHFFTHRLALSATPEVEGNEDATDRIFDFFGGVIARYGLKKGIEDKVLCPYRYYPFPWFLDKTTSLEYLNLMQRIAENEDAKSIDISLYAEKRNLMRQSGAQTEAFKHLLPKILEKDSDLSHTLVYCPPGFHGVDRSKDDSVHQDPDQDRLIASAVSTIRDAGSSATCILGSTQASERDESIQHFIDQSIDCLCAIGCLDEGVDIPSIKRAIVLASVDRQKQFIQRRGRILRKASRDDTKIADIWDVIILPQNSSISDTQAEAIIARELRRYEEFSELALNKNEASDIISHLLS